MKLLGVLSAIWLLGCGDGESGRWRTNTAINIEGEDPRATYDVALSVARASGYDVVDRDAQRGYFRVRSRVDNDAQIAWGQVKLRVSYIGFQVLRGGRLVINVSGFHVRGDVIHYKLDDERRELASAIGDAMRSVALRGGERRTPPPPTEQD